MIDTHFYVKVGDVRMTVEPCREIAVEQAKELSEKYKNKVCMVIYNDGRYVRWTPIYLNGKEK